MNTVARHENLLDAKNACLLVVDVQERFAPHIDGWQSLVKNISVMTEAARRLSIPTIISEQYVKGLGPTVSEILDKSDVARRFEKLCFAVSGAEGFSEYLRGLKRDQIIVVGIETHVCVNQTVHALLLEGYRVHVVEDAVGSRSPHNKAAGLCKMRQSGAVLTTVEMALFEMLKEAGTADFKAVQALVK